MADKFHDKYPILTTSYSDRASAERAYDDIVARGYDKNDVHVLMTEDTRKKWFPKGDKSEMGDRADHALKGAAIGGGVGGAIGATALGIAAAASTVAIPGVGLLIAGPLAGALAGGAAGATTGGLVGMLIGAGIPEDRAKVYETELKNGGAVIGVTPRTPEDQRYFEEQWHVHH